MRIAVCSDEHYPVNDFVIQYLLNSGHDVLPFGSLASGKEESWVACAYQAAQAVAAHTCEEGIFFCWSGTGIAIAANKVLGIRAALCTDAETARAARIWNHANVLALSNRLLTIDLAKEILAAWLETAFEAKGLPAVKELLDLERELYK